MIAGLGIDIVSLPEFENWLESKAFRRKVFTPEEQELCEGVANSAERYAGKFAAKEAFMKAIGKGIRQEVWFTQIAVLNLDSGAPTILASGAAEQACRELNVDHIHVSISHTEGIAVAIVLLETNV